MSHRGIIPNDLTITNMTMAQLETVLGWAAGEGWNPGLADAEAFYHADPDGFFVAQHQDKTIAAISVVNHSPEFAFLGLYICRPEWRGHGVGMAIWQHAIKHADGRTIGLDGVAEQEGNYQTSGFCRTGSSLRHEGRLPAHQSKNVRDFASDDLPALITLDAQAGGFSRPEFLSSWLTADCATRKTRIVLQKDQITGFATWRACQTGTKIGPIIAPDTATAMELIADIASIRSDGPLIIDVPEANTKLRQGLENAAFSMTFATARMYRGAPPVTGSTLQAIATMELG